MTAPALISDGVGLSLRAADALCGRPFADSTLYTPTQWQAAIEYAADTGDLSELEWMIDADAAQAAEDEAAHRFECRTGRSFTREGMLA